MSEAASSEDHSPVTGIIIVDHGSRKAASNEMLLQVVANFEDTAEYSIVEPAHMELASPTIATAFRNCVGRGAERVIVFPYFLSPGRHWSEDIPKLVEAAAAEFFGVEWLVTAPFGLHSGMSGIINDRIDQCLGIAHGQTAICDVCDDDQQCSMRRSGFHED